MKQDNTELFERMPVPKAVITLVIPIADCLVMAAALALFLPYWRRIRSAAVQQP